MPKKLIKRKGRTSTDFWHYELVEDKCTKRLVVYRCVENGCLETWLKRDFEIIDKKRKKRDINNGV